MPMTASLHGVRVACFFPWKAFEPTGAWSRFTCLWSFLLAEGADVTLAFLQLGEDVQLKDIKIRFFKGDVVFQNGVAIAQTLAAARTMVELKNYTESELLFLLMYEKGLYLKDAEMGPFLDEVISSQDIVMCDYPMQAPLLSGFCKKHQKPLIVTSLDVLYELHGTTPKAKERLKEQELKALRLADALVFCNEKERLLFEEFGLKGVTVLNTGDVLAVTPGNEEQSRKSVQALFRIKTMHFCLFVGSPHGPNSDAVAEIRRIAKATPGMTFVVAGHCCPKATEGNFLAVGPVSEQFLDTLHRGAYAVLVPLTRGTGISVKLFQAFIYGKPVISTQIGARGYAVSDGEELIIVPTTQEFPGAIQRLLKDDGLRARIAKNGRAHAVRLDYRTHFRPYADIINRLLDRTEGSAQKNRRALCLVDNNLSDRIGHHFNYALAIKEQCAAQGVPFFALIKQGAADDALGTFAANGAFSRVAQDDFTINPYPWEWGSVRSTYDLLVANDYFARELERGLEGRAHVSDTVFLPNATHRQILGLALLLTKKPIFRSMKFVLMFRYSLNLPEGPLANRRINLSKEASDWYAMAMSKLHHLANGPSVRFVTDSAGLAKEFSAFTERPVEVLPIPHTVRHAPVGWPEAIPVKDAQKIRIVYLGDAREEKGFEFLPAIVRACAEAPLPVLVEFAIQAYVSSTYHQRMALVIKQLAQLGVANVHLITTSLSPDEYQALLTSADLVLLPYDAATYRARTSGPFVEAICADKPVVVPRDSWMSDQLGASRAGVTFKSGNLQDVVRAVLSALDALEQHRLAAAELGQRFRAYHNPRTFLDQLMEINGSDIASPDGSLPCDSVESAGSNIGSTAEGTAAEDRTALDPIIS